ncbi:MAG: hypothetical protein ACJZ02_01375 [Candidatus Neomarinimicrobiota bacterium]
MKALLIYPNMQGVNMLPSATILFSALQKERVCEVQNIYMDTKWDDKPNSDITNVDLEDMAIGVTGPM